MKELVSKKREKLPGKRPIVVNDVLLDKDRIPFTAKVSRKQGYLDGRIGREIVCKYYDMDKDDFFSFAGSIITIDKEGLSFIARRAIGKDMPVLLRYRTPLTDSQHDDLNNGMHAQVGSCSKVEEKSKDSRYIISVLYH